MKNTPTMKNCKKKAQGYKIQVKFFCHFWFFVILGKIMKFMSLKFTSKKTYIFSCSFEPISVFISQKLTEGEQNNIGCFFFPVTVEISKNFSENVQTSLFWKFKLQRSFSMFADFFINIGFKNDWVTVWKFELWTRSQQFATSYAANWYKVRIFKRL